MRWASWRYQPPRQTLTGHTGGVTAVATAQLDGRPVAVSASRDRTLRVWDLAKRRPLLRTQRTVRLGSSSPLKTVMPRHGTVAGMPSWDSDGGVVVSAIAPLGADRLVLAADSALAVIPAAEEAVNVTIDLGSEVLAVAMHDGAIVVAATELGLVALRMPSRRP